MSILKGLKYPIIQAPMYHYSGHRLVISASKYGVLGSLSNMPPEKLQSSLEIIRKELGDESIPFAVNLFLLPDSLAVNQPETPHAITKLLADYRSELGFENVDSKPRKGDSYKEIVEEQIELVKRFKVPVVVFTFGNPTVGMVQDLKRNHSCTLISSATTIEEALAAQSSGVDAIILQGVEAGGHRTSSSFPHSYGQEGLISLLLKAKKHLGIPYIAAGGLVTHESIKACLEMGASACSIGSAFLLADECSTPKAHREALAKAWLDPTARTVLTRCFTGRPARMLPNRFFEQVRASIGGDESLIPWDFYARDVFGAAARANMGELFVLWSGQSFAGSAIESRPASAILDSLRLGEL